MAEVQDVGTLRTRETADFALMEASFSCATPVSLRRRSADDSPVAVVSQPTDSLQQALLLPSYCTIAPCFNRSTLASS